MSDMSCGGMGLIVTVLRLRNHRQQPDRQVIGIGDVGCDEPHAAVSQLKEERRIPRQAIQLGDDQHSAGQLGVLQRLRQFGTVVALATLNLLAGFVRQRVLGHRMSEMGGKQTSKPDLVWARSESLAHGSGLSARDWKNEDRSARALQHSEGLVGCHPTQRDDISAFTHCRWLGEEQVI